jgi:hypothetical protein
MGNLRRQMKSPGAGKKGIEEECLKKKDKVVP